MSIHRRMCGTRGMMAWLVGIAALAMLGGVAEAATIRVAIDGSGDFTVLPDAIAAAASGDTITIAPGIYEQLRTVYFSGVPAEVMGYFPFGDLTILGDDRDTVVIGPAVPASDLEHGPTGILTDYGVSLTVKNVTLRNMSDGINSLGTTLDVTNCTFQTNFEGVDSAATLGTTVRNCAFLNHNGRGVVVYNVLNGHNVLIEDCTFSSNFYGADVQVPDCVINRCQFSGGRVGFQVSLGGEATVNACTFENIENRGVSVTNFSSVQLFGNTFSPPMATSVDVFGHLGGSDNELLGGSYATIVIHWGTSVDFFHNHVINDGGYSVRASGGVSPPIQVMDFSNNYWGTNDPTQIDEWIYDNNDNPDEQVLVDYTPFIDHPVPNESSSFGQLKARFADPR